MANLRRWSSSASGNSSVAGGANTINFAEGQTPGSVNNSAREMMAQVRSIYTPAEWGWVEHSATASVASQTSFKISGDQTTNWTAGRRWRLKSGSTTRYGSVVSSSYTAETTITVTVDSGSLSASHSLAALSAIDGSSNQLPGAQQSFLRNRIINGDMRIDQRNAGGAVIPTTSTFTLDRWQFQATQASKMSIQQTTSVVNGPPGFPNYMSIQTTTAFSVAAGDYFAMRTAIEGQNMSDYAWGTANAKTVTLSFYAWASVSGTYGGAISNNALNRSYPFSYTVHAPATWQLITVTIPGDTTGTWTVDNTVGLNLYFGLGSGATFAGTAGAWAAANYVTSTGATSVVGTLSRALLITGVQLEAGSAATPYERRQYGTELALCQRYYEKSYDLATVPGTAAAANPVLFFVGGFASASLSGGCAVSFAARKRTNPTVTLYSLTTGTSGKVRDAQNAADVNGTVNNSGDGGFSWFATTSAATTSINFNVHWTASSEL